MAMTRFDGMDLGRARPADDGQSPLELQDPEIEVDEQDLLDEQPRSQARPSVAGAVPARAATALAAASESDRKLRDLLRTVRFMSATVQGACDTSRGLVGELQALERAFEAQARECLGLRARVRALEDELRATKAQAEADRRFLLAEQDAFVAALVADHDRARQALEERLATAELKLAARRA